MKQLYTILFCLFLFSGLAAQNLPSYLPANGLVGWWPFNGNANDESGNGNHGTVNGATLTADRFGNAGKAYSFDGVDDVINTQYSGILGDTSRSISLWAKSDTATNFSTLVAYGSRESIISGGTDRILFYIRKIDFEGISFDIDGARVTYDCNPLDGEWHHYVVVFDRLISPSIADVKIYFDGLLLTNKTENYIPFPNAGIINTEPEQTVVFGGFPLQNDPNPLYLTGSLDDIAMWKRALTQQEITALYQAGDPTALQFQLQQQKEGNCPTSPVRLSVKTHPRIFTDSVGSINAASATVYGSITNDGGQDISSRGICWSTSLNPTTDLPTKTQNGSGMGSFSGNLSGLSPNTTYYARAYAISAAGTWYGNELTFTTSASVSSATCGTPNIHNPHLSYGSMSDQDGNVYKTIVIGTQVWMAENLKTGHYRNGDMIPVVADNTVWSQTTSGASCWYSNDSAAYDCPFGRLYNWYTVVDQRGLCPAGWHVPSEADWMDLENSLGVLPFDQIQVYGQSERGIYAAVASKVLSISPLWQGITEFVPENSFGLSILPNGTRYFSGDFYGKSEYSGLWTSSLSQYLNWSSSRFFRSSYKTILVQPEEAGIGLGVRCIKNNVENGLIGVLNCDSISIESPIYSKNSTLNTKLRIGYKNGNGGNFSNKNFLSNGVKGLEITLFKGEFLHGDGSLNFNVQGYPDTNGTAFFQISVGEKTCLLSVPVLLAEKNSCGYPNVSNPTLVYDSISDNDGKILRTIKIGSQNWMAENLSSNHFRNGDIITNITDNQGWKDSESSASCWFDNDSLTNNCKYGKLYNWYAVNDARGLCPVGWRIPKDKDWENLVLSLGGFQVAGGKLKSTGNIHSLSGEWFTPNYSSNSSGFSGLPAGRRDGNNGSGWFSGSVDFGYWWANSEQQINGNFEGKSWALDYTTIYGPIESWFPKSTGLSVRCLQENTGLISGLDCSTEVINGDFSAGVEITSFDYSINYFNGNGGDYPKKVIQSTGVFGLSAQIENGLFQNGNGSLPIKISGIPSNPGIAQFHIEIGGQTCTLFFQVSGQTSEIMDVDGNLYNTIQIGEQIWFKENLKVSRYNNGDSITTGLTPSGWNSSVTGACSVYNNLFQNDSIFGKLYNWYAINDPRGLCPIGWHVPSNLDWFALEAFLKQRYSSGAEGRLLKITEKVSTELGWGTIFYGNNYSGFSAFPGGRISQLGLPVELGSNAYYWTSTDSNNGPWSMSLPYLDLGFSLFTGFVKNCGFSVRCLKD